MILAVDTSTQSVGLALFDGNQVKWGNSMAFKKPSHR